MKFKVDRGISLRYFKSKENELLILKQKTKSIQVYKINLNQRQKSSQDLPLEPNGRIDFSQFVFSPLDLFQTISLTNKNNILTVCLNNEIIFADLNSKSILMQLSIDSQNNAKTLKYFLTPTNLALSKFNNIMNASNESDDLIALGNLDNLVFINYDYSKNKVRFHDSNAVNTNQYESFAIIHNTLIAYNKLDNQLNGFYLKDANTNPFKEQCFTISLNESTMESYGLSSDCKYVYLVIDRNTLQFYRWSDNNIIAETKVYSKPTSIACTDEYLALAMQDRKIISFLIVDPLVPNSNDKIKKLESRLLFVFTYYKKLILDFI